MWDLAPQGRGSGDQVFVHWACHNNASFPLRLHGFGIAWSPGKHPLSRDGKYQYSGHSNGAKVSGGRKIRSHSNHTTYDTMHLVLLHSLCSCAVLCLPSEPPQPMSMFSASSPASSPAPLLPLRMVSVANEFFNAGKQGCLPHRIFCSMWVTIVPIVVVVEFCTGALLLQDHLEVELVIVGP